MPELQHSLPHELPWHSNCYLLLDGVSIERLPQKLYQWSEHPNFEPLYLGTELSGLTDISPCLVTIDGPSDPFMQAFLAKADQEWGYLIFASTTLDEVAQHLRWLLKVETEAQQTFILRLADPAVAHALFAIGNPMLFGPIEYACMPDNVEANWHVHYNPNRKPDRDQSRPYRLSDSEMSALEDVSFRQTILTLDEHLRTFFPNYQAALHGLERYQHLKELANTAYRLNLCSQREILLFANIFGFLGKTALKQHSDITQLLEASSPLPVERVEQAAYLAEQRATEIQGMAS
ncbi:DUF4123 domain-containing protein [Stutzerimonas nosocomialis]|uniref:DUF4123 domain-containing protein n=1 Tax=Stutzerimonas nosocomialis TaxID=1056496 RepID=UPI001109839C|nr:DUF4123 domain-containing protein [Stutzerimonas nosocomialis]TLX54145.1 DUF4123 domain-containing protein [Stutzerimonas nosocomialis]